MGVPVNPVPLTVTVLPPAWGPLFGLTAVTVGAGCRCTGQLARRAPRCRWAVVTVTSTVPVPAGTVTVRLVAVTALIPVPGGGAEVDGGGPGEVGAVDRDRVSPPAWGPLFGLTEVTVGAAAL